MFKKFLCFILSVLIVFCCGTVLTFASDGNITIEQYYTQSGSYAVSSLEFNSGEESYSHYKIWYPSEMQTSDKTYPVIINCNGTGITYSGEPKESALMEHLASWGYIAVANDDTASGTGYSASKGLDFLLFLNEDEDSIFYGKVNKDAIGLAGHSQGGSATINAASQDKYSNSDMFKALYIASAPHEKLAASVFQKTPYDASLVNVPAFLVAGTGIIDSGFDNVNGISPLELSLKTNMAKINNDNVIIAQRVNAEHGDMLDIGKGYMVAWFNYILLGDEYAAGAFDGLNGEIYSNPNWQNVEHKTSGAKGNTNEPETMFEYISELFKKISIMLTSIINALS